MNIEQLREDVRRLMQASRAQPDPEKKLELAVCAFELAQQAEILAISQTEPDNRAAFLAQYRSMLRRKDTSERIKRLLEEVLAYADAMSTEAARNRRRT